jgi:hypothetical protein
MDEDDSRRIDRQAKRTLSRAVQSDTQIKDLDVSQPLFFSFSPPMFNPLILFLEQAARTLG